MVSGPQVSSVFCWWLSHVSVASTEVPTAVLFLYFIPKPIQAFPTFSLDYDFKLWLQDVVFQSLSLVQLFVTPWTAVCQGSPSITNPQSLPKLMSIKLVMPSIHLILCRPLLPPSIFPSIRVFSNELALPIRWPKFWSFSSASVHPVNIQDWFALGLIGLVSLQSKGLSRACSNTIVQKHQFFGAQPCLWSNSHIHTWLLEKP